MVNREFTSIINWLLENILPPAIRDSRFLMSGIIWFAYGKSTKLVMEFKDKYPLIDDNEINKYYELVKDAPINKRNTDLNSKCLAKIKASIRGQTVLDAACGRGYLVDLLANDNKDYFITGSDIIVNQLLKNSRVSFIEADLLDLPFADKQFDTVICTHALEHIRNYRQAISELYRVTSKRLIIVIPCQREYRYSPDLHVNFVPYLYRFKEFIGIKDNCQYSKLGRDFICIIDVD